MIVHAQEMTITGTVSDETGPLPGVSVIIKGTTSGTETDFDGKYSITAKTGDILVFSFVGMTPQEKIVGVSNTINVVLEGSNILEEVVIVGYGTATKKSFAGTAKTVSAENIDAKSVSNISQALAGEVAGVTVINTSGQPGVVGTIRIRGYGSPNGNRDPLYVVDGVPFFGNLTDINPSDIKSTTVLKDATATAIYGSRGANGVILITTRGGTASESYIEIDAKTGINAQVIPRYDVLSSPEQFAGLVWEGLFNRGVVTGNPDPTAFANTNILTDNGIGAGYNMWNVSTGAELIDPVTRNVRNGVQRLYTPERFGDEAFGNGTRTETSLRIGGGNEKTKHFISFGYLKDDGYTINSDFERYTTRINIDTKVKEWINVGVNIGYSYAQSTNNGQTVGSENVFEFADKMPVIYPVFARFPDTGDLIPDPVYGGFQYDYGSPTGTTNGFVRNRPSSNLLNPIGSAVLDFNGTQRHGLNGNFSANFSFTDNLTLETRFGGQYNFTRSIANRNHVYGTSAGSRGTLLRTDTEFYTLNFLQLLRYRKVFGDHSLEVLAAHETTERSSGISQQAKQNVIQPGVYTLSNFAESQGPSTGTTDASGIESYFGQVNYNFAGKYYLTGSVRTDGSSRFVNDKWGVFGSLGGAWILSEEAFMADSFLSFLKAKISYGITGDQDGVTTASGFTTITRGFVGGALSLPEARPGNPDLTWETSKMFQAGVETSVGNYLDANFDYYRKNTDNLFFNQRRGPSAGFASILVNDGEALNAGFEFDVIGHLINNDNFQLDLSINGEILENKISTMPLDVSTGEQKVLDLQGLYAYTAGRSIFDFYMREWAGVDPTDGAPTWYQYYDDQNNNDILDTGEGSFVVDDGAGGNANGTSSLFEYEQKVPNANIKKTVTKSYSSATQVYLNKSLIPDLRGAFRLSGRLKNFDFSTQFVYSLGGYGYDAQYAELVSDRFGAASVNFHTDVLNRWQQPGDITDFPALTDNAVVNSSSTSSRFIISTDYIALNNARIGYTAPKKLLGNSGIDLMNIWISGDNLFTKTARRGFNPAVREDGNSGRRIYAPATTYTLGVRVKF